MVRIVASTDWPYTVTNRKSYVLTSSSLQDELLVSADISNLEDRPRPDKSRYVQT